MVLFDTDLPQAPALLGQALADFVAHSALALSAHALSLLHFSPANTGRAAMEANAKQTMIFFIGILDSGFFSLFNRFHKLRRVLKCFVQIFR